MTMPKYPEDRRRKAPREVLVDLFEAVALEELAIAHLINAEAEKIQAFTGHYGGFPTAPSNKQINEFQEQVARILEALSEKQKVLVRTLELSKQLLEESEEPADEIYE